MKCQSRRWPRTNIEPTYAFTLKAAKEVFLRRARLQGVTGSIRRHSRNSVGCDVKALNITSRGREEDATRLLT